MNHDLSLYADGKLPYQTPGQRLEIIRKKLSLTIDDVANNSGISAVSIWKMENDDIPVENTYLNWICDNFNIDDDWIWTGKGPMKILIGE